MANDSSPGFLSNPFPLVAMLLLAAGILVRTLPLESARPGDADRAQPSIADSQDVPARLWQDPFSAVNAAKAQRSNEAQAAIATLRLPATLKTQIDRFGARAGTPVQILGVMASTSAFAEDAEARRRERYAVVQALSAAGYVPFDPEGLGYVEIDNPQQRRLPAFVPFEWYVPEGYGGSTTGSVVKPPVLLLWLEENVLGWQPAERIARLIQNLCGHPDSICEPGALQPRLAFIGPGSSAALVTLARHSDPSRWYRNEHSEKWPSLGAYRFDFYSPFATNPEAALDVAAGEGKACIFPHAGQGTKSDCPIRIFRTIGGDDRLADLMSAELALRGVNGVGWECNDRVVIVAERDTTYGRELANQFRAALGRAPACDTPRSDLVWEVGYLRGLDGVVAEGATQTTTRRNTANAKIEIETLDAPTALRERAEGRSQFDYVRRLAQQIRDHEQAEAFGSGMYDYLRLEGAPKIKAIGVLGNDVYDKLLILQALHAVFPYAIFFTTDLDARLLHADQSEWTRNLLVAGNYGFSLRRELQGSTPPFRNSYQASAFLATLLAVQGMTSEPDAVLLNARLLQWQQPSVYELGRTRAIPLWLEGRNAATFDDNCTRADPLECESIEAKKIAPAHSAGLALATLATGLALLLMSSPFVLRKVRRHFAWALATVASLAIMLVLIVGRWLRPLVAELAEPFAWFEGVSLWPSLLVLAIAFVAALISILYISAAFRRAKHSIGREFFASTDAENGHGIRAWQRYDRNTLSRERLLRGLPITFTCFAFFLLLILLGKHQLPFRGEAVWICAVLAFCFAGFALLYLVFQVLDIVRHSTRFLNWLSSCDTHYPDSVRGRYAEELGLSGACERDASPERMRVLESWIDFRLVVRLTTEVERFIYFPFFVLLIFALAQIRLFDDWQISPSILVVVAIFVTYVMYCSYSLRRAAEAARGRALAHYNACLLRSAGGQETVCGPVKLIEALILRIRETKAGAFRPFFQRPALQSLLIPFGGMGGYSIVEFLFTRGV